MGSNLKKLALVGILLTIICLGLATTQAVGGFDWNRDFISTLLRGPEGTARTLSRVAVVVFCVSLALIFWRLSKREIFAKDRVVLQVGGIGSSVYSAFTITPLHDLVVSISMIFFIVAMVALLRRLRAGGQSHFYLAGWGCFVLLLLSAISYYTGWMNSLLPWGQRISFSCLTLWLVLMDWKLPERSLNSSCG